MSILGRWTLINMVKCSLPTMARRPTSTLAIMNGLLTSTWIVQQRHNRENLFWSSATWTPRWIPRYDPFQWSPHYQHDQREDHAGRKTLATRCDYHGNRRYGWRHRIIAIPWSHSPKWSVMLVRKMFSIFAPACTVLARGRWKWRRRNQLSTVLRNCVVLGFSRICSLSDWKPIRKIWRRKLLFTDVPENARSSNHAMQDALFNSAGIQAQGMDQIVVDHFGFDVPDADMRAWTQLEHKVQHRTRIPLRLPLVGKYVALKRCLYFCWAEAFEAMRATIGTLILICKCSKLKMSMTITLKACCKALMGFLFQADSVTVVWKAKLPRFAIFRKTIFHFGICLGMQMASVDCAWCAGPERCWYNWDATWYQGPDHWPDAISGCQKSWRHLCDLAFIHVFWKPGSVAAKAYDNAHEIQKRHRHRYEFNSKYRQAMETTDWYFPVSAQTNRLRWKLLNVEEQVLRCPNITRIPIAAPKQAGGIIPKEKPSFRSSPGVLKQ